MGLLSQFGEAAEDGVKGAAFTAPERVGDGQSNVMLGGHVLSSRLRHPEKGLRVDAQADRIDRSDSLVGFQQEGAKQLLPSRIGKATGVVLGRQPDRVDEGVDPTQPIEVVSQFECGSR